MFRSASSKPASGRSAARPPIDEARLEALALRYVERYATTQAKLAAYLRRKLAERGWDGAMPADVAGLAARIAALGYIDDRAFAESRAGALTRRGYGGRRVRLALDAAGVADEDREDADRLTADAALAAALAFARRRRIGPHAATPLDRDGRERALAQLLRAGHDLALARRIVAATPDDLAKLEAEAEGAAEASRHDAL